MEILVTRSLETLHEEELVELIVSHNHELAFAELYRRHVRLLVHTAIRKTGSKSTAEDLVQEIFVHFWLLRHKFDIQKNVQAYLNGMLKNKIIDHYRREQQKVPVSLDEAENRPSDDTQELLNHNVLNDLYKESLLKLPSKCRSAFELSRKGYSMKEIAMLMEISEKTVEAHISKALKILRIEMKDYISFAVLGVSTALI